MTKCRPYFGFWKKLYMMLKQVVSNLAVIKFGSPQLGFTIKATLLFQIYAQFRFLEKGLGLVSLPHFVHIFQEKYFLGHILSTNQTSLPDCLYFSRYWAI